MAETNSVPAGSTQLTNDLQLGLRESFDGLWIDMDIVTLGKSLNCPSRRTALVLLEAHGPLRVGELAARVGVSVSTMSFHVSRLVEAGLTVTRHKGRTTIVRPAWKRLALVGVRAP